MGLITRLRRVTVSRVEAFLATVEDPELLFPQLVKEMEDQLRAATDAEAKAMAAVKAVERELEQVKTKVERLQKGAALAMERGDEATAREAVTAQLGLESALKLKESSLQQSRAARDDAHNGRLHIQSQLDEIRTKKDEILTRARVAKTQKRVERTVHGPTSSARSILDAVAQLETKVEESEAELEVRRDISKAAGGKSLDKRLADLEKDSEVEQRLAALKNKAGG